eukprot:749481-Hanusia_phi.AAC.11
MKELNRSWHMTRSSEGLSPGLRRRDGNGARLSECPPSDSAQCTGVGVLIRERETEGGVDLENDHSCQSGNR